MPKSMVAPGSMSFNEAGALSPGCLLRSPVVVLPALSFNEAGALSPGCLLTVVDDSNERWRLQ